MAKESINFKPNRAGIIAVMKSSGVENAVGAAASRVASTATATGHGYFGSRTKIQSVSAHGYAYTGDLHAMRAEAKYGILNRSL